MWFKKKQKATEPVLDGVQQLYKCPTCGKNVPKNEFEKCKVCGIVICDSCGEYCFVNWNFFDLLDKSIRDHYCKECRNWLAKRINALIKRRRGDLKRKQNKE